MRDLRFRLRSVASGDSHGSGTVCLIILAMRWRPESRERSMDRDLDWVVHWVRFLDVDPRRDGPTLLLKVTGNRAPNRGIRKLKTRSPESASLATPSLLTAEIKIAFRLDCSGKSKSRRWAACLVKILERLNPQL